MTTDYALTMDLPQPLATAALQRVMARLTDGLTNGAAIQPSSVA